MPLNTKLSSSSANDCSTSRAKVDTMITISLDIRWDLSYTLDEVDAGTVDSHCRKCIYTNGNKVSLLVKADRPNHPDRYMWVGKDSYIVIRSAITDTGSVHVLFSWINLPNVQDFAFVLQSDLVHGQVVGVEKFVDGESLSLQLQRSDDKQHHTIYLKQNSSDYFALYLRSPEGYLYYILPINGLKIYKSDSTTMRSVNAYVFRIGTYKCSNPNGSCPFERLMRKY